MAKPNYAFEKRQRERAKKQKKEEKLTRKSTGDRPEGEPVEGALSEGVDPVANAVIPTAAHDKT